MNKREPVSSLADIFLAFNHPLRDSTASLRCVLDMGTAGEADSA